MDLFAGIGGFSYGLEQTGQFETAAFVEIDKAAQKVLRKHWPSVPIFSDVCGFSTKELDGPVEVITGGFPCQDISVSGRGAGLKGERSGLWFEMHRIIKEAKPEYAIIENVAALRYRGLDQVLSSLAEIGYDCEWHCIPASAVGAPHQRDRVWIVAYPQSQRVQGLWSGGIEVPHPYVEPPLLVRESEGPLHAHWEVEPRVGRVVDGFPGRVDRIKQLGNAIVPQIATLIGEAIIKHINRQETNGTDL